MAQGGWASQGSRAREWARGAGKRAAAASGFRRQERKDALDRAEQWAETYGRCLPRPGRLKSGPPDTPELAALAKPERLAEFQAQAKAGPPLPGKQQGD